MSAPVIDAPTAEVGEPGADGRYPIEFPALVIEGLDTGDGRYIEPGALGHRALPLSILAQTKNPDGGDGHDGAFVIGQLTDLDRVPGPTLVSKETGEPFPEGTFVWVGKGWGSTLTEAGRMVAQGLLTGNSADLVEIKAELSQTDDGDGRAAIQSGMIAATTLCPIPAFADAYVVVNGKESQLPEALTAGIPPFRSAELGDELAELQGDADDPRCAPCSELVSQEKRDKAESKGHAMKGGRYPIETADDLANAIRAVGRAGGPEGTEADRAAVRRHIMAQAKRLGLSDKIPDTWASDGSLKAALVAAVYHPPLAEAFVDPQFTELTPITITEPDEHGWRRIFGHIGPHGACHRGIRGQCRTVYKSRNNFEDFKLGAVRAIDSDGVPVEVAVGHVTMDTGHIADPYASAQQAAYHYDNTGAVVADVNAGDDEHGQWIAGILRHRVTDEQIHALRAAPPSGDWRPVDDTGHCELVAVLAVNSPGFKVARPAVREFSQGGKVTALVASFAIGDYDPKLPDGSPAPVGTILMDVDQVADGVAARLVGQVQMADNVDTKGQAVTIDYDVLAQALKDRISGKVPLPGTPEAYASNGEEPENEAADEAAEQDYARSVELRARAARARLSLLS